VLQRPEIQFIISISKCVQEPDSLSYSLEVESYLVPSDDLAELRNVVSG
jgi:hypothetical protein